MLVFLDLETTGLNPRTGSILEIAMIATDDNFVQIGESFVSIVKPIHMRGWEVMVDKVKEMHIESGLLHEIYGIEVIQSNDSDACLLPGLPRLGDVERAAITWLHDVWMLEATKRLGDWQIADFKKDMRSAPLAGNTVHFDKRWLIEHMDELEALFSHRIYDVSSFTEEVKRSAPEVYKHRPGLGPDGKPVPMHRALEDIQNSIATAKFYREHFFRRDGGSR